MALTALRDLLDEDKIWCLAARVALHDGRTQHYEVSEEGAMTVSVRTHRGDVQIDALLKGGGFWRIPPIGAEVMLCFDDGEFEGDAYIVATSEDSPDGLAPDKIFILADSTVEARSASGAAVSLAKQSSVTALENKLNSFITKFGAHTHILALTAGTGTAAVPANPETPIDSSTGTTVLRGE
jgi:hypothetical protein